MIQLWIRLDNPICVAKWEGPTTDKIDMFRCLGIVLSELNQNTYLDIVIATIYREEWKFRYYNGKEIEVKNNDFRGNIGKQRTKRKV